MKPFTQQASAVWRGGARRGTGVLNTPSDSLRSEAYASGGVGTRSGTSPPELIAAAHAGSFSMTLATELGTAGYRPRQIDTKATVTLENIAAGWTLTQIHLEVVAAVPGVAQCEFVDVALRAKANCPISRSLNANISMSARLSLRGATARELPRRTGNTAKPGFLQKKGLRRNRTRG